MMEPPAKKKKQENIQEPSSKSILDLNDDCLEEIFSYFSFEELFELDKVCPRFRNIADEYFYKKESFLEINEYSYCDTEITESAERLGPYVSKLQITYCEEDLLKPVWIHFTNLEHLIIKLTTATNFLICHHEFLRNVTQTLKSLELFDCELTDDIGKCLKTASKLESLSLGRNYKIRGNFLPDLKDQLKELDLSECDKVISGPYFGPFCKNNHRLEKLVITFIRNTPDSIMEHLDELKNLTSLRIEDAWCVPSTRPSSIVLDLPKITRLEIVGIKKNDWNAIINRLGASLEYLLLESSCLSTSNFLDIMPTFRKIKFFKICDKNFWNVHLSSISMECKRTLEVLNISGSNGITDEGLLEFLKDCPNMHKLGITLCRKITDALIMGLLPILKERPHILEIFVHRTKISPSIEEELKLEGSEKIKLWIL